MLLPFPVYGLLGCVPPDLHPLCTHLKLAVSLRKRAPISSGKGTKHAGSTAPPRGRHAQGGPFMTGHPIGLIYREAN